MFTVNFLLDNGVLKVNEPFILQFPFTFVGWVVRPPVFSSYVTMRVVLFIVLLYEKLALKLRNVSVK